MAEIRDPNLRLTILHSAWNAGLLPPFDKEAFYRDVLHDPWDADADYNDEVDERVRKHLLTIPLPSDLLAKLTRVTWDAGNEVFNYIWTTFDGESDEFAVRDLNGIEACKNLDVLEFTGGAAFRDCAPLAGLPKLSSATLLGGVMSDLSPLLKLASLKKLRVVAENTPSNQSVIDALRSRGVAVTVYDS